MSLNDVVFHRAASERLAASLARGEPFLDPWVAEWSIGFPVWRTYPPLAHLLGATVLAAGRLVAEPAAVFAALMYVLVVALPASVYAGARRLGLPPVAAGLAAVLLYASSSTGEPDRYGLGYGAVTWSGSGLFSQVVALHLLVLGLGATARALDGGRRRAVAAGLLAATLLAHMVFGYVAFVSAAVLALAGPRGERSRRLARLALLVAPALVLALWFLVPLVLARGIINHSRWEAPWKWDSFGAPWVLAELASGRLLDGGRAPLLTVVCAVGALGAIAVAAEPLARRLLALAAVWLALFFGRPTWGGLLVLAGVPADLHLHRLQAAFQLAAVLLAAFGLARLVGLVARGRRAATLAAALVLAAALAPILAERARTLRRNAEWGRETLAAEAREHGDLQAALGDVRAILAERPGRAVAGPANGWGSEFKVGAVPVFAFLSQQHVDQASFLFHAMSRTSDVMVLRQEGHPAHDAAFAVRAVVAPADRAPLPHWRRRSVHGRFAVYEDSPEGYFGLVDVQGHYTGPPATEYEPSSEWLASPLVSDGIVVALDARSTVPPAVARWQGMPVSDPARLGPRGHVVTEEATSTRWQAHVRLDRPCHVLLKVTWTPEFTATVDARAADVVHVTPGFSAVAVPAGEHDVVFSYRPRPFKPWLLPAGLVLFGLLVSPWGAARLARPEAALADRLGAAGRAAATPRRVAAAAVLVLAVVALHPLFRGRLVSGHDALEYPPRLVEMARVLRDGHVPPVWAPDLGAGHGQPLFEFAPPLVYAVALPFRAAGATLADALQLGLFVLHVLGAAAVYRIARRMGGSRPSAVAVVAAWLFAPYFSLDLFVRAAFAEASAVAVAPIALYGVLRAVDRLTPGRLATGAVAVALGPLAHNGAALLLLPALAVVVVAASVGEPAASRRARLAIAARGAAVIALGLGLCAYFWLPAVAEKSFVHVERLREGLLAWQAHLVRPFQLLWSRWDYGLSGPGAEDEMSFALGLVHLALAIAGVAIARRAADRRLRTLAFAFAALAAFGAWLSTTWAGWLWSLIEPLQYLAYPWRALLLPGLFLPLLAVLVFERVGPRWTVALAAVVVAVNLGHTEPKGYYTYDDEYYEPRSIASRAIATTTREEYEPRGVEARPPHDPRRLTGLDAALTVTPLSSRAHREELSVRAAAATAVESVIFYYPGWRVSVDGAPVPVRIAPIRGTMQFDLPAGEHRVVLELRPTGVRRVGLLASALSLVALVVTMATRWWRPSTARS